MLVYQYLLPKAKIKNWELSSPTEWTDNQGIRNPEKRKPKKWKSGTLTDNTDNTMN